MTRKFSFFLVVVALLGFLVAPAVASAQAVKIGVVDVARVINETAEGKAAKSRLEREMTRRQNELDRKQREFETFAADLESSFDMLTDEAKQQRAIEYQTKATELQQLYATHQQELAQAEAAATQRIVERVIAIVDDIAKRGSYTLVFDSAAVVYKATNTDITSEVIRAYDEKHP